MKLPKADFKEMKGSIFAKNVRLCCRIFAGRLHGGQKQK